MKNFRQRILDLKQEFFGRYGRVVTKQDWARIKKECPKAYREMCTDKSLGYCYYYTREIALFLEDAQLLYCSIKGNDGKDTAHAVIVKNNCVYCSNARNHFEFEDYQKEFIIDIYKIFSKEEYKDENFFDNIRDDFVKWCAQHNVYCNPQ